MPALVAGIHVFCASKKVVAGRNKSGHDAESDEREALARQQFSAGAIRLFPAQG